MYSLILQLVNSYIHELVSSPIYEKRLSTHYWVVLENNNKHLTQLSAEGPPLFRALRASLHEEVLGFFPKIGPEELESANV